VVLYRHKEEAILQTSRIPENKNPTFKSIPLKGTEEKKK